MASHPKAPDILKLVRERVEAGKLRYSNHALQRMQERLIIKPEVEYVLAKGHHNKRKDQFNEAEKDWDYAF